MQTVSQKFGTENVFWRATSSKNVSLIQNGLKNGAGLAIWLTDFDALGFLNDES